MMRLFEILNDDNFLLFAAKNYYKPTCIDAAEFYEDLNRFKYVKRLLNRYIETGRPSERLVLNHLIIIFNVFGIEGGLRMLEHRIEAILWPALKPYLILLKTIPEDGLRYASISMDPKIVKVLREI
jgi:hypothetical protein